MFINLFMISVVVIFAMVAVGQLIYTVGTKAAKK